MNAPRRTHATTPSPEGRWQTVAAAALLAAAAVVAYWPSLRGGFLWDDDALLTQNSLVQAADGLHRIWFTTQPLDYWPMTNSSFWLEWRLWGMQAAGYHVTNLLLHIGSALLLWAILRRLSIRGAFLAAFLFVLHPVNVESVAWIAQRKNTLSMVFFLLSMLWFLKHEFAPVEPARSGRPRGTASAKSRARPAAAATASPPDRSGVSRWYWLSLVAFVLAMLSKGSVVILPGLLLLCIWWRRGSLTRTDVMRTAPFWFVAVALTLVNLWFQAHLRHEVIRDATLLQRVLGAGAVIWFYLYKALLPMRLIFIYPQWQIHGDDVRWWLPVAAAVSTTGLLVWQRRRPVVRALLFAWVFFCLALVPVMGFTDVYFMKYSLVSDHYQYIALLAVAAAVAAGLVQTSGPGFNWPLGAGVWCAALLAVLGTATWRQNLQYANVETLWQSTLASNPGAWMAHNNLALYYLHGSAADFREAYAHLQAAVAINPHEGALHKNLGTTLFQMDRFEDAAEQHREAVRLTPDDADAFVALGADYQKLGRHAEAIEAYRQALKLNPQLGFVRSNVAASLDALGRADEASRELQQSLRTDPGTSQEHGARGDALLRLGRTEEAIAQYQEALRLDPSSVATMNNLGYALMVVGRLDEAERQLRQAVRLRPDDGAVHDNLGNVLQQMQRLDEAVGEFNAALKTASQVDSADVHNDLGVAFAKLGRHDESVAQFREALRLKPAFPAAQANLTKALGGSR